MSSKVSDKLQQKILIVVREVGKHQVLMWGKPVNTLAKDDLSPVTEVDLYSHKVLSDFFHKQTPETPILSEESSQLKNFRIRDVESFWCIDPLDGTRDFIEGSPHFAINIAYFFRGQVEWGLIYHPISGEFLISDRANNRVYLISKNNLTSEIQTPLHCDAINTVLTSARVAMNSNRKEQIKKFAPHLADAATILSISSSFKFFLLVKKEAQAYVRKAPCMIWDIAPGFIAADIAMMKTINLHTLAPFTWPENALEPMPPFAILATPKPTPDEDPLHDI